MSFPVTYFNISFNLCILDNVKDLQCDIMLSRQAIDNFKENKKALKPQSMNLLQLAKPQYPYTRSGTYF